MTGWGIKRRVWLFDKHDRWLNRLGWSRSRWGARVFKDKEEARVLRDRYDHARLVKVKT